MTKSRSLTLPTITLVLALASCAGAGAGDYETAPYTVYRSDDSFELRQYPELKVAATVQKGEDDSFMRLFRYIEGANETKESISMTTPVFMEAGEMRFVVPEKNRKTAPKPASEKVEVKEVHARTVAVYRFSGWRSDKLEKESVEKLQSWMKTNGIQSRGDAFFAYYDPPWTPGPQRRNEVLIPVRMK
jgi:predicted transcriptional regulator YdeE